MYDVIVIGAGPAGLTAAMYCARKSLSTLVLSIDLGGQVELTNDVENYPGFTLLTGPELIKRFEQHVKKYNVEIDEKVKVTSIEKNNEGNGFIIITDSKTHEAKSLIIASGRIKRNLDVPGEQKYQNKGISCMLRYNIHECQDKDIAVIGAGNSAMNVVFQAIPLANKIYLINKSSKPNADEISLNKIKDNPKVIFLNNSSVLEIIGNERVEKIKIKQNDKEQILDAQCVFVEIGYVPSIDFFNGLITMNDKDEIIINEHNMTNVQGVFAAGDVTNVLEKQIIVACGEGAKAALSAYEYLKKNNFIVRE